MTEKKILIAEDEKPMARALEIKLNKAGFETTVVFDGVSAVKELQAGKYDLLLLDLMMPNKDGFSVLSDLKEIKNKVPVIVSTNLNQKEDIEKAMDLGAKDYFVKSDTTISEVVDHVKKVLGL
ncbi:MAG: response regulator [Candidatus Magasanikbacteria bacterium CG_4_10_14_0_2_um_filter_33_14]|uniref:Response regulator n=1 Tax=Candidatus Magasanikbacteria bacterium CG_4_10_14_0_2_um_filter_33_14 TaxID=1974636 RepID=A0A2M7VBX9_9BACT|nr:MAG: response regulator [Candidatus Magasanikbacteria bacterium CG_4_10_14_0_2_um_filter_33_14]